MAKFAKGVEAVCKEQLDFLNETKGHLKKTNISTAIETTIKEAFNRNDSIIRLMKDSHINVFSQRLVIYNGTFLHDKVRYNFNNYVYKLFKQYAEHFIFIQSNEQARKIWCKNSVLALMYDSSTSFEQHFYSKMKQTIVTYIKHLISVEIRKQLP